MQTLKKVASKNKAPAPMAAESPQPGRPAFFGRPAATNGSSWGAGKKAVAAARTCSGQRELLPN
ncbi:MULTISPECIES: hypothetical protein [unclassified Flavobacterium]|uniref:hypothetical protein n=1 Tax=unclassified Flavobacterium TaxID=196869 RepID=UPI001F132CAD|nr:MULTISPECIES: hypothetical protein [unclassified Flavobacterium]UMY64932.1 hypothetical protein MKO97_10445 [Flavobacterium sp. HJ-32-4]